MTDAVMNVFRRMLCLLHVKHTPRFTDNFYESHPDKNNLQGISEMFSAYGVETGCFELKNVPVEQIPTPFITLLAKDFCIIESVGNTEISVYYKGKLENIRKKSFYKGWKHWALCILNVDKAIEPDYKINLRNLILQRILWSICIFSLIYNIIFTGSAFMNPAGWLSVLLNLPGMYFSYLTLKETDNSVKKKLCTYLEKGGCEKVHRSKAASLFGLYSLGEIGMTYFISDLIISVYFHPYSQFLFYINICAVFFSVWSIAYQKTVIRSWCLLCLIVQGIVILKAILWLIIGTTDAVPIESIPQLLVIFSVYPVIFYFITVFYKTYGQAARFIETDRKLRSVVSNKKIFRYLLEKQPHYDDANSCGLIFRSGTPQSELTILMNPFCGPCEILHKKLEQLITGKKFPSYAIRFLFTAYTAEKEKVIVALIGFYLYNSPEAAFQLINDWYNNKNRNKILSYYDLYKDDPGVKAEFERQKRWIEDNKFTATPRVLYDGYLIPEVYDLPDMKYFL